MKRPLRAALALVLTAAIGLPAGAGCCDDFMGCVGAVASGGLSCALQAALDDVRSLLRKITDQRDATTAAYNGQLQAQVEAALAGGDKILHEDSNLIRASLEIHTAAVKLAVTPAPSAASRLKTTGRVPAAAAPAAAVGAARFTTLDAASLKALQSDNSLMTLRQRLDELRREKNKLIVKIVGKEAEIKAAEMAAVQAAQEAYMGNFLKPIDDVIAALEAALKDPSKISGLAIAAANLVADAAKGVEVLFDRALGTVESTGNAVLVSIEAPVNELEKLAAEATSILAKMEKMTVLRTVGERRTLAAAAPVSPTPIPSTARKLKSHAAFAGKARTLAADLATLKPGVLRLGQPAQAVNVAPFRQRLSAEFDGYFRGKSPADAKKKLADLNAEARRRFASDPKTLAAVEKLLTDEARARGVPV